MMRQSKKLFKEVLIPLHQNFYVAAKAWGNLDSFEISIVAAHGWLDNANTFDLLARILIQDPRLLIVAFDFSGHGKSSRRPDGYYSALIHHTEELLAVMDYFGIQQTYLMGHSMGAGVSSLIAGCFPERVKKLILIESMGVITQDADDAPRRLRRYFDSKKALASKSKPRYKSFHEAAVARAKNPALKIPLSAAEILTKRGLVPVYNFDDKALEFTWRTDQSLTITSPFLYQPESVLSFIRSISCEVLIFIADDGFFDLEAPAMKKRSGGLL